ncbi:MAG: DNA-3-methyladenine glycosylase [Nitrosopumilaceae archaeon]|nr:DNA-3-methyladenine glycosylase [Nitrosopumilaceae archaeon]
MNKLPRNFYSRDTVDVAKDLLGKKLVRNINGSIISGIITETEAYKENDDPASHAYCGITKRNRAMFGQIGIAYIYMIYGMYYCVNVVARNNDCLAGAVLIRSLNPINGINKMMYNRHKEDNSYNLVNGPGKITQALQINIEQYGTDLVTSNSLYLLNTNIKNIKILKSNRIGVKTGLDKLWNFKIHVN